MGSKWEPWLCVTASAASGSQWFYLTCAWCYRKVPGAPGILEGRGTDVLT